MKEETSAVLTDKPRHFCSRLTHSHLDREPLCSHRHDLGARALPAAGVVDSQVPRARTESVRVHFVVARVSLILRVLREQMNRAMKLWRHLDALADRLE